jgi:hypothetical protein
MCFSYKDTYETMAFLCLHWSVSQPLCIKLADEEGTQSSLTKFWQQMSRFSLSQPLVGLYQARIVWVTHKWLFLMILALRGWGHVTDCPITEAKDWVERSKQTTLVFSHALKRESMALGMNDRQRRGMHSIRSHRSLLPVDFISSSRIWASYNNHHFSVPWWDSARYYSEWSPSLHGMLGLE